MTIALFDDTVVASEERLREFEADYTPAGVVRQCLLQLAEDYELGGPGVFEPRTFLDPSAGNGAWPRIVRELWPKCLITAIEIREEERKNLMAVADLVWIGPFDPYAPGLHAGGGFDLVATNPPFSRTHEWMPAILDSGLLRKPIEAGDDGGILCFFEKTAAFQRSVTGVGLMESHEPDHEYRIAQSVMCRGVKGESGDSRSYSHWVWTDAHQVRHRQMLKANAIVDRKPPRPRWSSIQLPLLDSRDRKHGS